MFVLVGVVVVGFVVAVGVGIELVVGVVCLFWRIADMSCVRVDVRDGGDLFAVVGGARCLCRVRRNVACTGYL